MNSPIERIADALERIADALESEREAASGRWVDSPEGWAYFAQPDTQSDEPLPDPALATDAKRGSS